MVFLASKLNCKFKFVKPPEDEVEAENLDVVHPPPKLEDLVPRPPVVAIVGHIDHGKTTLLDRLRKSNVVETEFGGITQHIGAFSVSLQKFVKDPSQGQRLDKVTFLDTPGHAAFKNMRVRGALVTDIVILVVDASEGPLEQTLESIKAVKKARVSLVVALNKIDKPNADVEKTKKALHEAGVGLEDFGGDVQAIPISALQGTGVEDLIEAVLAQAEVLQLSADPTGPVEASVIESCQERGLGKTATLLVKRGTLRKGQHLVCDETSARVRSLLDTRATPINGDNAGIELNAIGPAEACRVTGWKDLPHAGSVVMEVESEKRAGQVVKWRMARRKDEEREDLAEAISSKQLADRKVYERFKEEKLKAGRITTPIFSRRDSEARKELLEHYKSLNPDQTLSIVVKADVDGSLDAIVNCLDSYHEEDVALDLMSHSVGEVTENDLKLAQDFNGIIYAFNINVPDNIRRAASSVYNVSIREFNVIYALIDDVKGEISQRMPLIEVENLLGKGVVAKEFVVHENKQPVSVAGVKLSQGAFHKAKLFKVVRGKQTVHEGKLSSLKYHKDEVETISPAQGQCGLKMEDATFHFETGDVVICYELKSERQETKWSPGF